MSNFAEFMEREKRKHQAKKMAAKTLRDDERARARHGMPNAKYQELLADGTVDKYRWQRGNAKARGIAWEFTLASWWRLWKRSGKWDSRGTSDGMYVMARFKDDGAYSPKNVEIITCNQNHVDRWINIAEQRECRITADNLEAVEALLKAGK